MRVTALLPSRESAAINIQGGTVLIDGTIPLLENSTLTSTPLIPVPFVPAAVAVDNFSEERSGDIVVSTQSIDTINGGAIFTRSFASGTPGDISINTGNITILGENPSLNFVSGIGAGNLGSSSTRGLSLGNVLIDANSVSVLAGGAITSSTVGEGNAGQIVIDAERIQVSGTAPVSKSPSQISSLTLQVGQETNTGDSGSVRLQTGSLRVTDGAAIATSTNGMGEAGSIAIQAEESIEIIGNGPASESIVGSEAVIFSPLLVNVFNFGEGALTGNSGSVEVTTPFLSLQDGGTISALNEGTGNGGNLQIDAQAIELLSGQLSAATVQGDGGNITINSDAIALLDGSAISANSELSSGGQVSIESGTLLQSPDSLISASSGAGAALDGLVEIQATEAASAVPEIETPEMELPQVTAACADGASESSEFTITGRGGLPTSPENLQKTSSGWLPASPAESPSRAIPSSQIVEAQGWLSNGNGTIRFTDRATNLVAAEAQRTACAHGPVSQNRT
jgi:large exoprotein involved in heme utilization and adhesion